MRKSGSLKAPIGNEKQFPWNKLRRAAGLPVKHGANVLIDGFFIRDTRRVPNIAIFKNCQFEWKEGRISCDDIHGDEVLPFLFAEEAFYHIKSLHLSADDEKKLRITAMARDPGLGEPMPNVILMDRKELKQR